MACLRLPVAIASLILLVLAHPALPADAPLSPREWKIDGVARQALVYAPDAATKTDTPVVFAFHGHGGTMRSASNTFGIHKLWPEAIVIYMQGLPTPGIITDAEGKLPDWQKTVGDQQDRDLKFFDEVLTTLKEDYKVDSKRIYATGHTNGGAFWEPILTVPTSMVQ